jgi:integrase
LIEWLRDNSYSEDHTKKHREAATKIRKFMDANEINEYSHDVGQAFLKQRFKREVCKQHRLRVECIVGRINDLHEGKTPSFLRLDAKIIMPLSYQSSSILKTYLNVCISNGNKISTIKQKKRFCDFFLRQLEAVGCTNIAEMKPEELIKVCLMFQDKNAWSPIRMFLKYLHDSSMIPSDYSSLVPHNKSSFVLPSVYSEEDIRRIESTFDLADKTGSRDYAMTLLVTRYGLRSGDVAKLSFSELDFERNLIRLTQQKTGRKWESALLPEIKDALLNYINGARPCVDSDTVFIQVRAPYKDITISSITSAFKRSLKKARIDVNNRRQGPHAFRSSLASSMVNDDVPYEVVRRVLGHDDPNAIKHYAKIDIEKLREYAVPVPAPTGIFVRFLNGEVCV